MHAACTADVGANYGDVVAGVDVDGPTAAVDVGYGVGDIGIGMGDGGGAATQAPPGFFLVGADGFVVAALLCGGDGGVIAGCDVDAAASVDLRALGDKVVAGAHVQAATDVHGAAGLVVGAAA